MNNTNPSNLPLDVRLKHLSAALHDYKNTIVSLNIIKDNDDPFGAQGTQEEVEIAQLSFCEEAQSIYSSFTTKELDEIDRNNLISTSLLDDIAGLPAIETKFSDEETELKSSNKFNNSPSSN